MFKFVIALSLAFVAQLAQAQEFGVTVGVHETTADTKTTGTKTSGGFNFKLGLDANFELAKDSYFRTGLIYNQRHFSVTDNATGDKTKINFNYVDIPANYQYNFTENVGLFGGLVVAINTSDSRSPSPSPSIDTETLLPLVDLGFNFLFNDMVGFDVYYERGLGKFADDLQNFSTFGANFIYWF